MSSPGLEYAEDSPTGTRLTAFISKHDIDLFAYFDYLVLFLQSLCHLDALKTSKFGLGLYK